MREEAAEKGYPVNVTNALIGSCTNSSYEDISRAAHIARQAKERTQQDHAQNPELGAMFHSDATNSTPDAATLFAATAPRRYNLN